MLLTDDGDLTYRLTHPSFEHDKEYWVLVAGRPPDVVMYKWRRGVQLEDGIAKATCADCRPSRPNSVLARPEPNPGDTWFAFVVHEGRKHQIRRMCEAVDVRVKRLARVRIASIHIGDLRPASGVLSPPGSNARWTPSRRRGVTMDESTHPAVIAIDGPRRRVRAPSARPWRNAWASSTSTPAPCIGR